MFAYYYSYNFHHLFKLLLLVCIKCENYHQIYIEGVNTEYRLDFCQFPINEIRHFQGLCFLVASNTRNDPVNLCTECHNLLVVYEKIKQKYIKALGHNYFLACLQMILTYPYMALIYGNEFLSSGEIGG